MCAFHIVCLCMYVHTLTYRHLTVSGIKFALNRGAACHQPGTANLGGLHGTQALLLLLQLVVVVVLLLLQLVVVVLLLLQLVVLLVLAYFQD